MRLLFFRSVGSQADPGVREPMGSACVLILEPAATSDSGRRAMDGRAMMTDTFPGDGVELTHILVVSDPERSVSFYRDVLGADLQREYGGSSAVFSCNGAWLLVAPVVVRPTTNRRSPSILPRTPIVSATP